MPASREVNSWESTLAAVFVLCWILAGLNVIDTRFCASPGWSIGLTFVQISTVIPPQVRARLEFRPVFRLPGRGAAAGRPRLRGLPPGQRHPDARQSEGRQTGCGTRGRGDVPGQLTGA